MSVFATQPTEAHAIKCDLAAEVLRSSSSLRLQVTGSSMLPAIWPGDMLMIERISAHDVSEGEIVLFARDCRLFVHRVVKLEEASTILTRGDAMPEPDPPVPGSALLGRVSWIVRNGRLIKPGRLNFSQKTLAALIGSLVRNSELATRLMVGIHGRMQVSARQNSCDGAVPCRN